VLVIPLMTAMRRVLGRDYVDVIEMEIASLDQMSSAEERIRRLMILNTG